MFNLLGFLRTYFGSVEFCQCGHDRTAHKHYRRGMDCAQCDCGQYRPAAH